MVETSREIKEEKKVEQKLSNWKEYSTFGR